jgi:hypothetical protein
MVVIACLLEWDTARATNQAKRAANDTMVDRSCCCVVIRWFDVLPEVWQADRKNVILYQRA